MDCPDTLDREERLWVTVIVHVQQPQSVVPVWWPLVMFLSETHRDSKARLVHPGLQVWLDLRWVASTVYSRPSVRFLKAKYSPPRTQERISCFVILGTDWWDWTNGRSGPPWTPRSTWWARSSWSSRKRRSQGEVCFILSALIDEWTINRVANSFPWHWAFFQDLISNRTSLSRINSIVLWLSGWPWPCRAIW